MNDISNILAFGKDHYAETNYANFPFNGVIARRTLKGALLDRDSRVWVTEHNREIRGVLIGEIGNMPFTHYTSATDLIFLATGGGTLLLDAFISWCELRNVARMDIGISAGAGRDKAIERLLRSRGFVRSGGMFHKNFGGLA